MKLKLNYEIQFEETNILLTRSFQIKINKYSIENCLDLNYIIIKWSSRKKEKGISQTKI